MRKIQFVPGEHYHIFNHGVDEKKVFLNTLDFKRALVSLVTFNDKKNSPSNLSRFVVNPLDLVKEYTPDNREKLVDIIAFTFLPTHYHLFVKERARGGISCFMHRFSKGYARYFNLQNNRKGSLWREAFGASHIDNEAYFAHIISYIHLNILDLYDSGWREGKIKNWSKVAPKLSFYPWSSYGYYRMGSSQIPFIDLILTQPKWFTERYPEPKDFEKELYFWSTRLSSLLGNEAMQ